MKQLMTRRATTGQVVTLKIEGKLTRLQKHNLFAVLHNCSTTVYGADVRDYFTSELKSDFDKVGFGGNHIWFSNSKNERLAIITI